MGRKIFRTLVLFLLLFILALLALFSFFSEKEHFISYTPAAYTESADFLQNPWEGFYQMYSYDLSDDFAYGDGSFYLANGDENELAMLLIRLSSYRNQPISDYGLKGLDALFAFWKTTGRQIVLRFTYDWDGNAQELEPDSLQTVFHHIAQISDVVNKYHAFIYIHQGILIGNFGEMHDSNFASQMDYFALGNHLLDHLDPSIFLAVRTPVQWREMTGYLDPVTEKIAFQNTLAGRFGLFNDGMLGSATDLGTFPAEQRNAELAFQYQLSRFVPSGGEAVLDNPYNDLETAIPSLKTMHISYLNDDWDPGVLNKWKNTTYQGDDLFDGISGYEYIQRHMGYRFVLRDSSVKHDIFDDTALVSFTLENVGFSNCYKELDMTVEISGTLKKSFSFPVVTDLRYLDSGESVTYYVTIPLVDMSGGMNNLCLRIIDPITGREILLGNELSHTATGYHLGDLNLSKTPKVFSKSRLLNQLP